VKASHFRRAISYNKEGGNLMMKKMIVGIAFLGVMASGIVHADDTMQALKGSGQYGAAGCGLGSMVFGNQPGVVQIFAATTNETAYSQTFGITTGTSNCGSGVMAANNPRLNEFMVANLDTVAKEMAMGKGESLDAMAELMGIAPSDRPATYAKLQSNFSNIFASEQVEATDVIDQVAMAVAR
jgi:hypothetical protein